MSLGLGVMLRTLAGNESTVLAVKNSLGKEIESVKIDESEYLYIYFTDNTFLKISDEGQSCCEHRYMSCDDDFNDFEGSILLDFELKNAPSVEQEYDEHDIQFLDVKTNKGIFTITNHNIHNGYYGGFCIEAKQGIKGF